MTVDYKAAAVAVEQYAKEGRLVQRTMVGVDAEGRAVGCLMGATAAGLGARTPNERWVAIRTALPGWLVGTTTLLFDALAPDDVVPLALRFALSLPRWGRLAADDWEAVYCKWNGRARRRWVGEDAVRAGVATRGAMFTVTPVLASLCFHDLIDEIDARP